MGCKMDDIKVSKLKETFIAREAAHKLAAGRKIDIGVVWELLSPIRIQDIEVVFSYLVEIENIDIYTYLHSINVAFYAILLCKWLELPKQEIEEVAKAAMLHDIGKTKICLSILNKKEKLLPEEFEELKRHTVYGYEIIKEIRGISEKAKEVVLLHHEREDRTGYPRGINGSEIGKYSKIVAIADVFDAMTSDRVYKKRTTPFEAFEMFRVEGANSFDAGMVKTFLTNLAPLYVGANVMLNTGVMGEIVQVPAHDIECPVIRVKSGGSYILQGKGPKILFMV